MGDLNRRKGLILDSASQGDDTIITAAVPLNAMFGYSTALRSATQVRGGAGRVMGDEGGCVYGGGWVCQ